VSFGPEFGRTDGPRFLTVAYGIYGNDVGIHINTIRCGSDYATQVAWNEIAHAAAGEYASIDPAQPVDPHVRPRIQLGRGVSARDYILALAQQKEHQQQFAAATAEIDALLTPTTQTAAIPVEQVDQTGTPAHFTRPGNYLGLCGVALPSGFTGAGLPTSLQILCPGGQEALALRIAWAYEQATSWRERRPPAA